MTEQDRNQALALAAIFQAGLLADQVASSGQLNRDAARPLLDAVLKLDTDDALQVYSPADLRPGLSLMLAALRGGQRPDQMRPVGHGMALVQLANSLRRNQDLVSILRHRLEALAGQDSSPLTDDSIAGRCQRFAGVYVDTLGTMKYRIRVQGDPRYLQEDEHASAIRALFLAGVRAAFLWHAQGGRRWHLLFSRRRLMEATNELLRQA